MVDSFAKTLPDGIARVAYIPSLAYRIAMIAAGKIDATFVKPNSHDWDLVAADLILSEAGGGVVSVDGGLRYGTLTTSHPALAAGSADLLAAMARHLGQDASPS